MLAVQLPVAGSRLQGYAKQIQYSTYYRYFPPGLTNAWLVHLVMLCGSLAIVYPVAPVPLVS